MDHPDEQRPDDTLSRRLWTPWRMTYVGGETRETGCIFCNRLAGPDDVRSLILHRGREAFVIMNLFPYNTGHVMIVPNEHVATPEDASGHALAGMTALLPPLLRALRRVLNCHGFNVGFNVGAVAGAGVAEHLHQHVVPRWTGDANFMPIIASTMVIPELIPVAYAKIRAELQRELDGSAPLALVVLDASRERVLRGQDGDLPSTVPADDSSVWMGAVAAIRALGIATTVAGWAGPARGDDATAAALTLIAAGTSAGDWLPVPDAQRSLSAGSAETLTRALAQLAPEIARHPGAQAAG